MTREEFEIFKAALMERFYWCTTRAELHYLTKQKGYKVPFPLYPLQDGSIFLGIR